MQEITQKDLIYAFTGHPADPARQLTKEELLERLEIGLGALRKNEQPRTKDACNLLRGALIRLAQAYGDPEVGQKIDEIVEASLAPTIKEMRL